MPFQKLLEYTLHKSGSRREKPRMTWRRTRNRSPPRRISAIRTADCLAKRERLKAGLTAASTVPMEYRVRTNGKRKRFAAVHEAANGVAQKYLSSNVAYVPSALTAASCAFSFGMGPSGSLFATAKPESSFV